MMSLALRDPLLRSNLPKFDMFETKGKRGDLVLKD